MLTCIHIDISCRKYTELVILHNSISLSSNVDILYAKTIISSQNNYSRIIIPNKITIILKQNVPTDHKPMQL